MKILPSLLGASLVALLAVNLACSDTDDPGTDAGACECGFVPPFAIVIATSCAPTTSVHAYTLSGPCSVFEGTVVPTAAGVCTVTLADGAAASLTITATAGGCCGDTFAVTTGLVTVPDAGSVGDVELDRSFDLHELVIPDPSCSDGGT